MNTQIDRGQARLEKQEKRDRLVDRFFRRTLHWIERIIALITLAVLLISLGIELYNAFTTVGYLKDIHTYLHHILTIVVGMEFVRMLIDTTYASILEVLTVAITRHVILNHDDPWGIVICVACIGVLFLIRRFLIQHNESKKEE